MASLQQKLQANDGDQRKNQLDELFEHIASQVDITELKSALMKDENYDDIVLKLEEDLPGAKFRLLKAVLDSEKLKKWKEKGKKRNQISEINMKLKILFKDPQIKHDISELINALLNNLNYEQILVRYSDEFSGKEMKIIDKILNSSQLKSLLFSNMKSKNQNVDQKSNQSLNKLKELQNIFADVKGDTKKLQELIILGNKKEVDAQMEKLSEQMSGRNFQMLKNVLKSQNYMKFLKKYESTNNQRQTKIKSLFQGINFQINDLIEALVQNNSIQPILQLYQEKLNGRQFRTIKAIIDSDQFKRAIQPFNEKLDEKSILFDEIFKELNTDINALKQVVLKNEPIENIMKVYEEEWRGRDFKKLKTIISSDKFKKQFCSNELSAKINNLLDIAKNKFSIFYNITKFLEKTIARQSTDDLMTQYENALKGSEFKNFVKFINSSQVKNIIRIPQQKNEREKLIQQFMNKGVKINVVNLVDCLISGKSYKQQLQTLFEDATGKQKNIILGIIEEFFQSNKGKNNPAQIKYNIKIDITNPIKQILSQEDKQNKFQQCWKQRTEQMKKKLDKDQSSKEIYSTILQMYNNNLQQKSETNSKATFQVKQQKYFMEKKAASFETFQSELRKKFIDSFNGKFVFQSSNQAPVMNIQKKKGDLKFNYLDMSKYFEDTKAKSFLSVQKSELKNAINYDSISKTVTQFIETQSSCTKFFQALNSELKNIGIIFIEQKLKQCIQEQMKFRFWNITTWKPLQLISSDIIQIKGQYKQYKDQYGSIYKNFVYFAQQWLKNLMTKKTKKKANSKSQSDSEGQYIYLQEQKKNNSILFTFENSKKFIKFFFQQITDYDKRTIDQYYTIQKMMVLIVNFIIKNYSQENDKNQICQAIKKDLELINIRINNIQNIFKEKNQRNFSFYPIINYKQFKDQAEAKQKLKLFSSFWDHKSLEKIIQKNEHQVSSNYQIMIGYYLRTQISIKKGYEKNKILMKYINKEYNEFLTEIKRSTFTQFVNQELNYKLAFDELISECNKSKVHEKDMKKGIQIIINTINSIVLQINKDLKQVSQKLRYDFLAEMHFYGFHILWKLYVQEKWKQNEQIFQNFNKKKEGQLTRFLALASGNPFLENHACAEKFAQFYVKFINQLITKDKEEFLKKKKKEYKLKYSREKVQNLIEIKLNNLTDPQEIKRYLLEPVKYTQQQYLLYEEDSIKQCKQHYQYLNHNLLIKQLEKCISDLRDSCGDQAKCISQEIFHGSISEDNNKFFIFLLIQVLCKQRVDSKSQFLPKIKDGRVFKVKNIIQIKENLEFLESLKKKGLQITNLCIFLKFLSEKLQQLSKTSKISQNKSPKKNQTDKFGDIMLQLKFTQHELVEFRKNLAVQICQSVCPCCNRNCDVDLEFNSNHSIHKCNSGHQMRAIGGMRIQFFDLNGVKNYKASIQRCEDIAEEFEFEFNNKPYKWSQFKLQKKNQWDFNFQKKNHNAIYFQYYWKTAGQEICKHYEAKDGIKMDFVPYNANQIKTQSEILKASVKPNHYIFALDQSGSMSGKPWNDLMDSMRDNIRKISDANITDNQLLSILKFNSGVTPVAQYENPRNFNINRITYGGGGTVFGPVFENAYTLMNSKKTINNIFIFISDGQAEYPAAQIQKIKSLQQEQTSKGLSVQYVSILIGYGSGGPIMNKIKDELKGTLTVVASATNIANVFKEVMKGKNKN